MNFYCSRTMFCYHWWLYFLPVGWTFILPQEDPLHPGFDTSSHVAQAIHGSRYNRSHGKGVHPRTCNWRYWPQNVVALWFNPDNSRHKHTFIINAFLLTLMSRLQRKHMRYKPVTYTSFESHLLKVQEDQKKFEEKEKARIERRHKGMFVNLYIL